MKLILRFQNLHRREVNKPRILIVGPVFPNGGGVGMVNKIILETDLRDEFDLYHLDTDRGRTGPGKEGTLALVNFWLFIRQFFRLGWLFFSKRPQIMHQSITWGASFWKETSFILLARICRIKTVGHIHGSQLDTQILQANPAHRWFIRVALGIPDRLIVLSEYWRDLLLRSINPKLPLVIIPNTVDPTIAEVSDRMDFETGKERCVILFLGWICVRKGVLDAIKSIPIVLREVPEVCFVFGGAIEPGLHQERVKKACDLAREYPQVSFPGMVIGIEKLTLLAQASIFILPSYHENLPVAILEAMAMGLPVVTTAISGIRETIEDSRNGFLIQPGDYLALAERIIRLAKDSGLRQSMGKVNNAKFRKDYHPRVFAFKIAQIYRSLLENSHPGEFSDKSAPERLSQ
jgi:glycosyltransferase involved in cell wall biosynthesis